MDTGALTCCCFVCLIALIIFYFILAMDSIEPLQYGVTYNSFTKSIGTEVYENGRYTIGIFKSFLIYPANYVTIEFSNSPKSTAEPLKTRTAEGLGLTLHISFQYQVIKDEIPNLYYLANVNYHGTYVRISRDVILKVAGKYNATNYWTDRRKIGEHMKIALDQELSRAFAKCVNLQVIRIDLPNSYEDSIVATQVEVQKTNMRKFEQTAELIRQNISVVESEANQKIKVVNAEGDAEAYRINQNANVFYIITLGIGSKQYHLSRI